jgi:hypothetical protein
MSFTPPPPEREALPGRQVALGIGVSLVFVAACLLVARGWELYGIPSNPAPPARVGESEIGRVFQRPFALEDTAKRSKAEQREQLDSYGWVDREHGIIHIPIERAMQAVVATEGEHAEPKP